MKHFFCISHSNSTNMNKGIDLSILINNLLPLNMVTEQVKNSKDGEDLTYWDFDTLLENVKRTF